VLGRWGVAEGAVQTFVVKPAEVLDDRELELLAVRQTRSEISSVLGEKPMAVDSGAQAPAAKVSIRRRPLKKWF
jgi:hypothetical protein